MKLRGFRIELGEIEATLEQHPDVIHCVTILREDDPGEQRLVAYLTGRDSKRVSDGALREHLRTKLPDYMVPSSFVDLASFPLTLNGKVDCKAFPAPNIGRREARRAYLAPSTVTEERLVEFYADVLCVERVGTADNFFELGGHSLSAGQIVSRIRSIFQIELPLRAVFDHPTRSALGTFIESLTPNLSPGPAVAIEPLAPDGAIPLSSSQQRAWFLQEIDATSKAYHFQADIRLQGRLDPVALESALNEIVKRHEILRTTFHLGTDGPYQRVHSAEAMKLPVANLESVSGSE